VFKKFILIVCGSFVGCFLAFTFFLLSAIVSSIAFLKTAGSFTTFNSVVQGKSVLKIDLDATIEERAKPTMDMFSYMGVTSQSTTYGLDELLSAINNAANNSNIEGILLQCGGISASPATLQEVRRALAHFKQESGKWIVAYGNMGIAQADYYLASLADSILINPVASVDIHGLASVSPYYKDLLDNVGVDVQVLRVGTFKSAVEPYILNSMSDANRLQQEQYIGSIWADLRDSIAAGRGMDPAAIDSLANGLLLSKQPEELLKDNIIDGICYFDSLRTLLKDRVGIDADDDLHVATPADLATLPTNGNSGNEIAVVYAVGEIDGAISIPGMKNDGIDSEELTDLIIDLAKDDHVKGMVLRVNSPGGSAHGSEQIWSAVQKFKQSGKPIAVSMGDYTASGGYYISCAADRIFAEPTTITGSIGIFGLIPNGQKLFENKLGIHFDGVKSNENADAGASILGLAAKPLTPTQVAAMQNYVNNGYELFVKRCADGRNVSTDSIKMIAEGRVWDGKTAITIGLVDQLGDLQDAIAWTAKQAGFDEGDYGTGSYPTLSTDIPMMLQSPYFSSTTDKLKQDMGLFYESYENLQRILHRHHILCLMPEVTLQ